MEPSSRTKASRKRTYLGRGAVLAALLLLTFGAYADDADRYWPQWRGPQATGVAPESDPPVKWGEDHNVRWKVAVPGKGNSSPIVWGDKIFLTTAIPSKRVVEEAPEPESPEGQRRRGVQPTHTQRFVILALDRATGKTIWERTALEALPHEGTHLDGTWAAASPVTDGERVFAHFGSNGLYAYDLSGTFLWSVDLGDMQTRNAFGEGSSPAVHGDTLIVNWDHEGEDSFIVALDKRTGKELWRRERDEPTSWSTPLIVDKGGRTQVVVAATGRTRGYDLATGDIVWEAGGMTTNTIPSPVERDGTVYVMSGFRGNALQAIRLEGAKGELTEAPAIAWTFDRDTPYVPSPLLYGDGLYFLKHNRAILSQLDADTGEVRYGPVRLEGMDGVYASPVGAADRVYITGRNGVFAVLNRGGEFEVLATNLLKDTFDASPAVAGDELYLRGHEFLYCIAEGGKKEGSEKVAK